MELWTEYEGVTIDGVYPLRKLLLSQGRSAFYSTSNGTGGPTVIRLVACHFDEDEILTRWRGVQALGHPNLLKLSHYGQVMLDGAAVVYAVIEPVEANLSEIVSGRRLTVAEATQLAVSIASALEVLHTNGFVHEHVEPANIFAVGEIVKLRSDCIRETPEGAKGQEAKRRDLQDFAVVLLEALTQERTLEAASRKAMLPSPFDRIVPNCMNGTWSIAEVMSALQLSSAPQVAPRARPSNHAATAPKPDAIRPPAPAKTEAPAAAPPKPAPRVEPKAAKPAPPAVRLRSAIGDPIPRTAEWTKLIAGAVLLLFLLVWGGRRLLHTSSAEQSGSKPAASGLTASSAAAATGSAAGPSAKPANPHPAAKNAGGGVRGQWRVVAYTYNRQDQAQKKAAEVARKHPELRPEVFKPDGRSPYLVAIGGVMNRDEAIVLAKRARSLGLPRDTYAQNYTGKGH